MSCGKEQWNPDRRLELKECNDRIQRVRNVVLRVHPNKDWPEVIDWLLFGSLARKTPIQRVAASFNYRGSSVAC